MTKKHNLETRDLIGTIIEKNLIMMGIHTHDKITDYLKNEYRCTLLDCYTKSKILNIVLKKQLGNKLSVFIKLMEKDLQQINFDEEIAHFFEILRK